MEYISKHHSTIEIPSSVGSKVKATDLDEIESFSDGLPGEYCLECAVLLRLVARWQRLA